MDSARGAGANDNRLFLATEELKTVEVFNLWTGDRIHSIPGSKGAHMMGFLPESNNLIVTDESGMVALAIGNSYEIIDTIKLPVGVDHAVLHPVNRSLRAERQR